MKGKISIIVPVYKVEEYLPKCVDSILAQTYQDFELILVDDGSPDQCGKICDDYAARDGRVKVIHKLNAGVAMARNSGLDAAEGEFVKFVDSDDWMEEKALETLAEAMSEDVDCVVGACAKVIQTGKAEKEEWPQKTDIFSCTGAEAVKKTLTEGSAVWNRLFRREIFLSLRFPKDRTNDDEYVALRAYSLCRKVVYLPKVTYFYRIRPNSITTSAVSDRTLDLVRNARENIDYVGERHPEFLECAQGRYYTTLIYVSWLAFRSEKNDTVRRIRAKLHVELAGVKKKARRNPYVPWKHKILSVIL